jgi:hypothetical protein
MLPSLEEHRGQLLFKPFVLLRSVATAIETRGIGLREARGRPSLGGRELLALLLGGPDLETLDLQILDDEGTYGLQLAVLLGPALTEALT